MASSINEICSKIDIIRCPPVHTIVKDQIPEILSLIAKADIILHQPISENFGVISSDSIRSEFPNKTFLSFPSIYFSGLFPQLGYLRRPRGGTLVGPLSEYHDMRILRAFQNNITADICAELIMNDDCCYQIHYNNALAESRKRENLLDISIMPLIEEHLAKRPCLYTFNHPDNIILYQVATSALAKLNISFDTSKPPRIRPFLDNITAAIPRSIPKLIGADWERSFYSITGNQVEFKLLVKSFYELYASFENLASLTDYNRQRINIPGNWPNSNCN